MRRESRLESQYFVFQDGVLELCKAIDHKSQSCWRIGN